MSNTSSRLSVASERPIDPRAVEILRQVDRVARELEIEYFVTGAMARDILLDGVFGLDTGRATRDVDVAIALHDWPQFEAVKRCLIETGTFAPDEGVVHRLLHLTGPGQRGYPLDLIPFGPIEEPANKLAWPPDRSIIMNVAGYRDAFAAAPAVEIHPGFVVRVSSLPGAPMPRDHLRAAFPVVGSDWDGVPEVRVRSSATPTRLPPSVTSPGECRRGARGG